MVVGLQMSAIGNTSRARTSDTSESDMTDIRLLRPRKHNCCARLVLGFLGALTLMLVGFLSGYVAGRNAVLEHEFAKISDLFCTPGASAPPPSPTASSPAPPAPTASPSDLLINEIASSDSTFDAACANADWVELFNPTSGAIDLRGVVLSDDHGPSSGEALALGVGPCPSTLPPGEFLLLCGQSGPASRHSIRSPPPDQLEEHDGCGFAFGIGGSDTVSLYLPGSASTVIDTSGNLNNMGHDSTESMGRRAPSKASPFVELARTPGRANDDIVASPPPPPHLPIAPGLPQLNGVDLGAYSLQHRWVLPDMSDDLSGGVALTAPPGSPPRVLLVTNDPTKLWQYSLPLGGRPPVLTRTVTLAGWEDTEGLTLLSQNPDGGATVVITEERRLNLGQISLPPLPSSASSSVSISVPLSSAARTWHLDGVQTASANKGAEGVAYDPQANCLYVIIEKLPMRVLRVEMASGAVSDAFDAQAVLGPLVSDLAGICFVQRTRTLLILSQESKKVIQVTPSGQLVGVPLEVPAPHQPEGIVLSQDESSLYLISEPNELYVYANVGSG